MNDASAKTCELVKEWIRAKNAAAAARQKLNTAVAEEMTAANELGKWLVPEGQNNEPFNIWYGSGILRAVRQPDGTHTISWRKEPDGKDRLEHGF